MPLILTAEELRAVDAATITEEGISSLDLMERAAGACAIAIDAQLREQFLFSRPGVVILCGRGNNGGDGWVLGRLLIERGYSVEVIDFDLGSPSTDNAINRKRAEQLSVFIRTLGKGESLPAIPTNALVIDAVFGTGLNRPVSGAWARVFAEINQLPNQVWSVDIPSGVYTEQPTDSVALNSDHCFSLGYPKLAEFAPENESFFGEIHRVDFSLISAEGLVLQERELLTPHQVASWISKRSKFGHKGTYGHALLIAGSYGSVGAAVLSASAALRAGVGKLTCHLPACGYQVMQTTVPEAMCVVDTAEQHISAIGKLEQYTTLGIGPGIGQSAETAAALYDVLSRVDYPIVLDADALNILSNNPDWLPLLPKNSVLTPHPKEFDRLFGEHPHTFARWETQRIKSMELGCTILLKGGYSTVSDPAGKLTFNPTGNPGMGSAGMGDVLTGMTTGLIAQGYSPEIATRLGGYLHGLSGDLAAAVGSEESLIAGDVVEFLGKAFTCLRASQR